MVFKPVHLLVELQTKKLHYGFLLLVMQWISVQLVQKSLHSINTMFVALL